jgi:Domain of unknown function (DUF4424)
MKRGRTLAAATTMMLAGLMCLLAIRLKPAQANDSSAAIAAGGLVLVKNDQVRMVSEVLRIAPRLVQVDYVFENTSRADVTTEVAFPLPDLDQSDAYFKPLNIPLKQSANFVGFQVWIDGQEIEPEMDVRAFGKSGEITDALKRLGLDLVNPVYSKSDRRLVEALRHLNAISDVSDDETVPQWTTKVSFHWLQTFPSGKRVLVRHSYRPVYGNFYIPNNDPRTRITKNDQKLGGQWCFDQSFNAAELRLLDRHYEAAVRDKDRNSGNINYENVQYVLKTGANWQGPIGRFELQIDKGGSDLVSTCPIPGVQLLRAPYGFKAVANDYTPVGDLDILFVSGGRAAPPYDASDPMK